MCVPGCMDVVRARLTRRALFRQTSLAAAGAMVVTSLPPEAPAAPSSFKSVLDLTHTLSPDFPTFTGTPGIEMERLATSAGTASSCRVASRPDSGTHLDAPIHFSEAGTSVEGIEAATLVAPLAVVDVAAKAEQDADYLLSRADLAAWEAKHGTLPPGCCVAMHSGWGRLATADPARFIGRDVNGTMHFPGIAPEAAEWLMKERQAAGLAVDTLSLDNGPSREFKTHQLWLPSGPVRLGEALRQSRAGAGGGRDAGGRATQGKGASSAGAAVRLHVSAAKGSATLP